MSRSFFLTLVGASMMNLSKPAQAQTKAEKPSAVTEGQFVIRRGADTVAVERFTRDEHSLTGEIVQMAGPRIQYVLLLKRDGKPERVDLTRTPKQGAATTIGVDFLGSTAHAMVGMGGEKEEMDFATPLSAAPFLIQSFALTEEIVRTTPLATGQQEKRIAVRLGAGDTATVTISRIHADSVLLSMADVSVKVALDSRGRIIGAVHSRQPWTVERTR